MISALCKGAIYLVVLCCFFTISNCQNVTIPLNKTITSLDKELYSDIFIINRTSTFQINLKDVNPMVSFIIFQAHSHLYNIILYNNTLERGSYISGTNLGLYSPVKKLMDTFFILNNNEMDLKVLITVHGYYNTDPIPGGGNIEFPIYISPFMYAKYNRHYINVDAQPAIPPPNSALEMKFYMMYLPEDNFEEDIYFNGLRNMMTKANILENGVEIPVTNERMFMRRMLSAYPGTGSVYVAMVYHYNNENIYSVYVPTFTYACSPLLERDCQTTGDALSLLSCAALLFVGLFICFFGHRFFKTEMFFVGVLSGVTITYVTIAMMKELESPALLGVSLLSGIFFGLIWLLFWWFYGIPVLAVFLTTLNLGFLCSAIIYYRLPGAHPLLQNDGSFWSFFIMIMLLTSLVLLTATFMSNILCCAVIGAYATVFSIDHYIGSNLKYIIINTVRRAVVNKFNFVLLAPPFQWRDAMVTLLWIMLAIGGFFYQHYHNRGKPPFPPPPRGLNPGMPGVTPPRDYRRRYGAIEDGQDIISRPYGPTVDARTPLLS